MLLAMNICGFQVDAAAQAAIFGFALTLASEVIGMSKLKENSLLQLVLGLLRSRVTPPAPTSFSSSSYRKSGITQSGKEGSWSTARVNFIPFLTKQRLQNNFDERHAY